MIAFSDPNSNWPTIDYNFNPRRTSAAMEGMEYSPTWERDHSFYRLFDTDGIQEDWIMFRAGDKSAYCTFIREDILAISLLGVLRPTTIIGSDGVGLRHGEKTNHLYTGASEKAHPLVGCEGSYAQNQNRLLWAENGAGLGVRWKNEHGGVGVFVRSADFESPRPVLVRVADSNHSQIQVVFHEKVEDANHWVKPNIHDYKVRMGPYEYINITEYKLINATFQINGTSNVRMPKNSSIMTPQDWYDIRSDVSNGIWWNGTVYQNVTRVIKQRKVVGNIVDASLTSDGNLTLELEKDVEYGVGVNIEYTQSDEIDSRYTRRIGDVYHNQVVNFGPMEGFNQINPMLVDASIVDHLPHILNMTFSGRLQRIPNVHDFHVSVDNKTVPLVSVHIDYDGRVIVEIVSNFTSIWRPWSATTNTVYDPMQPIDVSYVKAPTPPNSTFPNATMYHAHLAVVQSIEATHLADNYMRAVSTFQKLTVQNYVRDTTSPVYRVAYVYDSTPNIIMIEFTELSLLKICDLACGTPHADDFRVVIDNKVIPNRQMKAYIPKSQGKVYLQLLNYTITYQQVVLVSYTPSLVHPEQQFMDSSGNPAKFFVAQRAVNLVNLAPRVALISDLRRSVLQIYFTGTGANIGTIDIKDWTVWYEYDQRGVPWRGRCTDLVHPLNGTQWSDDAGETCEIFQKKFDSDNDGILNDNGYCLQFGSMIPANGAGRANDACCVCGGGTHIVQLLGGSVVKHPTMGRVDLLLPHPIVNGETLVVKYLKNPLNSSLHVGGRDGLVTNSWNRLVVENNVWPEMEAAVVQNNNASLLTLMFTGRGIVRGLSQNEEFQVTLEDCRLCTLDWHAPVRTMVHPVLVERVFIENVPGDAVAKRKVDSNHGHVNLTLNIPVRHYHRVYLTYKSRWDNSAPRRDDTIAPIHDERNSYLDEFGQRHEWLEAWQILSDNRDLPVRNFTRYHVENYVNEEVGHHELRYVDERKNGYSDVSEPLLAVSWWRTNVTAQYVSVIIVTPLGRKKPVSERNAKCTSSLHRIGTHLAASDLLHRSPNTTKERSVLTKETEATLLQASGVGQVEMLVGEYVHQWHVLPGCEVAPTAENGCMNGTVTIRTPSHPGDYRLQLWTFTNATLGTYKEMMRRTTGGAGGRDNNDDESNLLRTNKTLMTCGREGGRMGIPNEEAVAMPPMLDLALMEPTYDILLHVQYTININVPYFHVRNRELDSNRNVVESNVDVVNPFVPVHLRVIEGDPYQQYTVEFSSNPLWVTGDSLFGYDRPSDGAGLRGGRITVQIIDTCSQDVDSGEVQGDGGGGGGGGAEAGTQGGATELEVLNLNGRPSTVTTLVIDGEDEKPLSNWTTIHAKPIVRSIQVRTYDNIIQEERGGYRGEKQIRRCQLRHYVTPTNGKYDKWDVALVVGSRDRVPWKMLPAQPDRGDGGDGGDGGGNGNISFNGRRHYPSGTLFKDMPTIDLEVLLEDDESLWMSHSSARLFGWLFAAILALSTCVRLGSTLYWRLFDAFDLRDLNNQMDHRCLEVQVAGTRHPSSLLGSHRFYAASCIWTLLHLIHSYATLGHLRLLNDRATIVGSFIDTAFGTLTGTSIWLRLDLTKYFVSEGRSGNDDRTAAWDESRSVHRRSVHANMTYMATGGLVGSAGSAAAAAVAASSGSAGSAESAAAAATTTAHHDYHHHFDHPPSESNGTSFVPMSVLTTTGQTRSYDLPITVERYMTSITLMAFFITLVFSAWILGTCILRFRVRCLIRKLILHREASRPIAMTSEKIVVTTKKATTASALSSLRRELHQIEMYEQFVLADMKRKRKKSALTLDTPEGLDYVRIARLHDIVRLSSVIGILIFVIFPGLVLASMSIFVPTLLDVQPGGEERVVMYTLAYWTSIGVAAFVVVVWLATWLFFACWVPKATTFVRISIQKAIEEARALQSTIRETKYAASTPSRLRGRWYVTRYDRNILRRCGWLLDTVVKHGHFDPEDEVRIGGTIIDLTPTIEKVNLMEERSTLLKRTPSNWPVYQMGFQLITGAVACGMTHVDRTGVTQVLAMLLIHAVHFIASVLSWPKNIRRANYFLIISAALRVLFLMLTLLLHFNNSGHSRRFYLEVFMAITLLLSVLPPFLNELYCTSMQVLDVVRIFHQKLNKGEEVLVGSRPSCQKRMRRSFRRRRRAMHRMCSKVCRCCVEDYMATNPSLKSKVGGGAGAANKNDQNEEESSEDEDEEEFKKKKVVIQVDQMSNAESPKEEMKRLRKALEKYGYSTEARKMNGHK